jgi:hypothetical protein
MIITVLVIQTVLTCVFLYKYRKYKRHAQELFKRSFQLELTLIHIYNRCPEDVRVEITKVINSIKPL